MKLTIDLEEKTVEVPNGTLLNELIANLKELVGTDWSDYKLIFDYSNIYYPPPQVYPVYPYTPYYESPAYDLPYKVTCSTSSQSKDNL